MSFTCIVYILRCEQEASEHKSRTVVVAVEDSPHSERAWLWALDHFIRSDDQVTLVTCVVDAPVNANIDEVNDKLSAASESASALLEKYIQVGLATPTEVRRNLNHLECFAFHKHCFRIDPGSDAFYLTMYSRKYLNMGQSTWILRKNRVELAFLVLFVFCSTHHHQNICESQRKQSM